MFVRDIPVGGGTVSSGSRIGSTALPCREAAAPDIWFAEAPAVLEHAKALCGGCPMKAACLAAALRRGEPWGVWGGQILHQGNVIARKRPRGRPRRFVRGDDQQVRVVVGGPRGGFVHREHGGV
jgi:WhiB family redox-sensing transcriptional regulator